MPGRTVLKVLGTYGLFFSEDGVVLGGWGRRVEVGELEWYILRLGIGFFQRFEAREVFGCEMLPEGRWGGEGCVWYLLLLVCHC